MTATIGVRKVDCLCFDALLAIAGGFYHKYWIKSPISLPKS
jgi:hypothetical protein